MDLSARYKSTWARAGAMGAPSPTGLREICSWVEEHIEDWLPRYRLPRQHHKHLPLAAWVDVLVVAAPGGRPHRRRQGQA